MYHLSVITLEKTIFDDEVLSLIAPGEIGYLEILTNHAPIITSLQPGKLTIKNKKGEKLIYALSGGFLEMSQNQASLLADAIESPSEIDVKRAEEALGRVRKLIESKSSEVDIPRAKKALRRAENRLKIHRDYCEHHAKSTYSSFL